MLLNDHNTQLERDRANRKRQEARARTCTQRMETDEKIQVVQDEIQQLTQTNKGLATRKKEIQEIKKNLQESAGLKRSPRKKTGSRGKARLPDIENLQASDHADVTQASDDVHLTVATNYPPYFSSQNLQASDHADVAQASDDVHLTVAADYPPYFSSQFGNKVANVPPIVPGLQSETSTFSSFPATQPLTLSTQTWFQSPPRGPSSPISYRNQYFLPPPTISPPRSNRDPITLDAELEPTDLINNPPAYDPDFDLTPYM